MASRDLSDLDSRFRPLVDRFIEECGAAGISLRIITTLRGTEEQAAAAAHGVSWTLKSKHLPQLPEGKSHAIDVCPVQLLEEKGWAPKHPLWWQIGAIGRRLGLRWGGNWSGSAPMEVGRPNPKWDPGHFEWKGL